MADDKTAVKVQAGATHDQFVKAFTDAGLSKDAGEASWVSSGGGKTTTASTTANVYTPTGKARTVRSDYLEANPDVARSIHVDSTYLADNKLTKDQQKVVDTAAKYGHTLTAYELQVWGDTIRDDAGAAKRFQAEMDGSIQHPKIKQDDGTYKYYTYYTKAYIDKYGKDIGHGDNGGENVIVWDPDNNFSPTQGDNWSKGNHTGNVTVWGATGNLSTGLAGSLVSLFGGSEAAQRDLAKFAGKAESFSFGDIYAGDKASQLGGSLGEQEYKKYRGDVFTSVGFSDSITEDYYKDYDIATPYVRLIGDAVMSYYGGWWSAAAAADELSSLSAKSARKEPVDWTTELGKFALNYIAAGAGNPLESGLIKAGGTYGLDKLAGKSDTASLKDAAISGVTTSLSSSGASNWETGLTNAALNYALSDRAPGDRWIDALGGLTTAATPSNPNATGRNNWSDWSYDANRIRPVNTVSKWFTGDQSADSTRIPDSSIGDTVTAPKGTGGSSGSANQGNVFTLDTVWSNPKNDSVSNTNASSWFNSPKNLNQGRSLLTG